MYVSIFVSKSTFFLVYYYIQKYMFTVRTYIWMICIYIWIHKYLTCVYQSSCLNVHFCFGILLYTETYVYSMYVDLNNMFIYLNTWISYMYVSIFVLSPHLKEHSVLRTPIYVRRSHTYGLVTRMKESHTWLTHTYDRFTHMTTFICM